MFKRHADNSWWQTKIVASIKLFMGLTRDVTPNNLSAQEQSLIDSNPQSFILALPSCFMSFLAV